MGGGNSHQRAVERAAKGHVADQVTEAVMSRSFPDVASATETARIFDFIEQPLVLGALFALGGIVGALIYTPIFIMCALCILLGFHRAGVVSGRSLKLQAPVYLGLALLLSIGGYFIYGALDTALERFQTGFAKKVSALLKSPPVLTFVPPVPPAPQSPFDVAKQHLNSDPDKLTLYDLFLLDFPSAEAQYQTGLTIRSSNTHLEWAVVWNIAEGR
ncbi:MAG TPA: hypothetical protein VEW05_14265 [Candidatus Polarisedimenticolia bacterium]|nr:hypothetical protein [Candidatus Polarisedimenticolia bacterium]